MDAGSARWAGTAMEGGLTYEFQPRHKFTEAEATDISYIKQIRNGRKWDDLRFELFQQGRLPERG